MRDASDDPVLYDVRDGVATLTLNRPEKLNPINGRLSTALNKALDAAASSAEVRVILITGAGRAFSAGADVAVLRELSDDPHAPNSGSGKLAYGDLLALPKPVIAAVNGPCVGAAFGLACCADIRIAAESAFFTAPFVAYGLPAETGVAWLLPRLLGVGTALDLLLSGRRVTAAEALDLRLVSKVWPDAEFSARAHAYAAALARAGAPAAMASIKQQVYQSWAQSFAAAEADAYQRVLASYEAGDFSESMAARAEKRAPAFVPVVARFGVKP
ncbi:MAG: enoyl-CoA hydratase/isomerase family protein [Hyphomonadaceae bacterium]